LDQVLEYLSKDQYAVSELDGKLNETSSAVQVPSTVDNTL
jgi:hypothetical protein